MYAELGPLAAVIANYSAFPGFPPIQLVIAFTCCLLDIRLVTPALCSISVQFFAQVALDTPPSIMFLPECNNTDWLNPDYPLYTLLLLLYSIIYWSMLGVLFVFRKEPAVRVRHLPLETAFAVFDWFTLYSLVVLVSYGARASCVHLLMVSSITGPTTCFFVLLRSLHLLFIYRWSEARLKLSTGQKAREWCAFVVVAVLMLGLCDYACVSLCN